MLTFASPLALGLLASLAFVGLFYFLRMRFRRQEVSSTYLWSRLAVVNDGGARLRWRSLMLLVLQLLAATLLTLAVAGLQMVVSSPVRPGTLYILDTSASMAAREPGETKTRLEMAKDAILANRKAQGATGPVALFAGQGVQESADGSDLTRLLAAVQTGDGDFAEGPAVATLGTWLQTNRGTWSGVLVTDGGLDQGGVALARLFPDGWKTLGIGGQEPNRGITDLRVGDFPQPGARITLFNGAPASQTVSVALSKDGRPVATRDLAAAPGTSVVPWDLPGLDRSPGLWTATLVGNQDPLASDDSFTLAVEAPRAARILHLGPPDPFLRAAFPGAEFVDRSGTSAQGGPWDLVLVRDKLPTGWTGNLVTFGVLPAGAPVFWGQPVAGQASGAPSAHPLSRWVPWDDLTLTAGRGLVLQPGAAVLAEAGGWPVVATWDQGGYKALALGFDTRSSNLGLTPVLPVLMRNFRQAVVPQEANPLASNLRVGRSGFRAGSPDWKVTSTTASGPGALGAVRHGGLWELTPREAGVYTWTDGTATGVIAVQRPAAESDITPRALAAPEVSEAGAGSGLRSEAMGLVPWLALAALGLLVLEWRLWNGRFDPRGNRSLATFRVAAAAATLLALAGLSLPWPTTDRSLVLLFDTSASLGPSLVDQERQAALKVLEKLGPSDRVALVSFAARPRVLSGLAPRDQARRALEAVSLLPEGGDSSTDLQAALAAGAQVLAGSPGTPSQMIFTDGRANAGGDLGSLSSAARRYPISVVPLGRNLEGVAGQGLDIPAQVRPGEKAVVRWRGWADQAQTVVLGLTVDGVVRENRRVTLAPGAHTEDFVVEAGTPGNRRIDVTVTNEGGTALPSAQASGILEVEGKTAVLVVRGPNTSGALAAALEHQGLPVVSATPADLPDRPEGYQNLSAVVLDNVPAPSLTADQQGRLKDWVAGGGGLLVVGGDSSLGRGEYWSSALEALLPVQTDNRQRLQFTRSRILFVVDHSGSMSEAVGRTTKLEAALGGIAASLDELTVQDEVGILQFDSEASWVLPFTPLANRKAVVSALDGLNQGGGTDLTKALDEVALAFGHPGPVKRHVILLTDGQTGGEDAFFQDFTETMKAAQVSMTVIGIGDQVNDKLLGDLAQGSDGVYYRAVGDDIPAILHKETVRVTRDLVQEGRFTPLATGRDPVVDLGTTAPPVLGYLITKAKTLSRVRWGVERAGGTDPLYTDWRFGAGRVAVFASDSGHRWLAPWSGRPEYNRFWAQAVRSLESGARDKTLGLEVNVEASVARVVVEALDEGGRIRSGANLVADHEGKTYPLTETSPGRYEAAIPLDGPGLQQVAVSDRTGPGRTWAWAWNPGGAEGARGGVDWGGLGQLAAETGGLLQPLADPAPPAPAWAWAPLGLGGWLLTLALVLLVVELGWRSLSLGQWDTARTQFVAWWTAQSRPWSKPIPSQAPRDEAEVERRTREAYKYLASRKRPGA